MVDHLFQLIQQKAVCFCHFLEIVCQLLDPILTLVNSVDWFSWYTSAPTYICFMNQSISLAYTADISVEGFHSFKRGHIKNNYLASQHSLCHNNTICFDSSCIYIYIGWPVYLPIFKIPIVFHSEFPFFHFIEIKWAV